MTTITTNIGETDRLMSSVGVGMWTWDGRVDRLVLDPTCKGFFELDWDADTPQTVLEEKLPAEDLDKYRAAIQECRDTGRFACEFRVAKSAGGFRYLSGRGHTVQENDGVYVIKGVFIDVTATKELEGRFAAHRSRMQALVDGIPGLFSYIDRDYKVLFMSSEYRDIFGKELDELTGVHIASLLGEEVFAERKARYDAALAGDVVHSESNRLMPDGSTKYFAVTHQPYEEQGQIVGVITLGIDITERRRVEEALQAKSFELQRSNRDLEQFAYVASHDLKSPLRAIEVIIEWLRDDLEDYDEGDIQENLDLLGQRTGRLTRLLDDLLAYSRAGRKVGDVQTIDLGEFVTDIAALIAPPAGLEIKAGDSMPGLTTHHVALETVLRNLMSNAIKHHSDPSNGHIQIDCVDKGNQVQFSVTDDGPGIPAEYAEKVFKMFQTLRPRDETEGSGMGLAIVQRIIDWQGGEIWFEDGPDGKGVTFYFTWNKQANEIPTVVNEDTDEGLNEQGSTPELDGAPMHERGQNTSMNDKDDEDENETCKDSAS
jgi:PAS domain S-box-containing protein